MQFVLTYCQDEFTKSFETFQSEKKIGSTETLIGEEEKEYMRIRQKRGMLGNVTFISELFVKVH